MSDENGRRQGAFQMRVWLPRELKLRFDAVRPAYVPQSPLVAALVEAWVVARERGLSVEDAVRAVGVSEVGSE